MTNNVKTARNKIRRESGPEGLIDIELVVIKPYPYRSQYTIYPVKVKRLVF